jgi:hypothetical protein
MLPKLFRDDQSASRFCEGTAIWQSFASRIQKIEAAKSTNGTKSYVGLTVESLPWSQQQEVQLPWPTSRFLKNTCPPGCRFRQLLKMVKLVQGLRNKTEEPSQLHCNSV